MWLDLFSHASVETGFSYSKELLALQYFIVILINTYLITVQDKLM